MLHIGSRVHMQADHRQTLAAAASGATQYRYYAFLEIEASFPQRPRKTNSC